MRCPRTLLRSASISIPFVFALVASGCHSVDTELASLFGDAPAAKAADQAASQVPDTPKFYIELRESGHKPELIQLPLAQAVYIQQALDQSGATRKFRRMKIQLFRKLPGGGGHRLDIDFDRNSRQVPSGMDYALHANDRLVVTEDTSTVLDDMLSTLGAPIGK